MGMVADSASMQALPLVNIVSKKTSQNTVSNMRGSFTLTANPDDTIIFSRVGYVTKELAVARVKEVVIIFLKEELRMLKAVEIEENKPFPWLKYIAESAWRNVTNSNSFTQTPGFQGVQTFGPGYVFKMPGSGFKKEARAKKKLQEVQQENDYARDYIHTVNGPEVKGKIMEDYGLSEEDFYRLLALFNKKNKDFIYKLETHEALPLLFNFYAAHCESPNK